MGKMAELSASSSDGYGVHVSELCYWLLKWFILCLSQMGSIKASFSVSSSWKFDFL